MLFRSILLDLSGVSYVDSAGLGELVAWKKRALELGGDIRLARLPQRIGLSATQSPIELVRRHPLRGMRHGNIPCTTGDTNLGTLSVS